MIIVLNHMFAADATGNIAQIRAERTLIKDEIIRLAIVILLSPPLRESYIVPVLLSPPPRESYIETSGLRSKMVVASQLRTILQTKFSCASLSVTLWIAITIIQRQSTYSVNLTTPFRLIRCITNVMIGLKHVMIAGVVLAIRRTLVTATARTFISMYLVVSTDIPITR